MPTSQGDCAQHVRRAIEAGGIQTPHHPYSAKDYGPYLRNPGFSLLPTQGYTPAKGDIVVIQNYPGGNVNGHIAMFDGTHWVSDFRQNDIWAGPGDRHAHPPMQVFRP